MNNLRESAAYVVGIPVVWIQPDNQDGDARIVLWLPWLTGTKEAAIPFLAELAGRGCSRTASPGSPKTTPTPDKAADLTHHNRRNRHEHHR